MNRRLRTALAGAAVSALAAISMPTAAYAEASEVKFAQQFGLLYLPLHVVVDKKMVQACAKEQGLGDIKVTMHAFSGGAAVNQALLSGNVDFAAGGIGPLLKLWDKTKGSIDVRAAINLAAMPLKLNTNDPRVKKLEDYVGLTDHKIATPSVKVSIQAVILQMAAKKKWGEPFKLDDLTVSMKHPSAVAALFAGGQAVRSHFATLPFSWQELQKDGIRNVLHSYDVLGGRHTTIALYNTKKYRAENPKLFGCVRKSFGEAMKWINSDIKAAAALFHRFTKSKLKVEDVEKMLSDKNEMYYSIQPERTMEFATFLHSINAMKNLPTSWKDYYWDENHNEKGS